TQQTSPISWVRQLQHAKESQCLQCSQTGPHSDGCTQYRKLAGCASLPLELPAQPFEEVLLCPKLRPKLPALPTRPAAPLREKPGTATRSWNSSPMWMQPPPPPTPYTMPTPSGNSSCTSLPGTALFFVAQGELPSALLTNRISVRSMTPVKALGDTQWNMRSIRTGE